MEQGSLPNVNIAKAGEIQSGKYNEIKVKGGGTVKGDIECNVYDINGASVAKGNIKANIAKVSGMTTVEGGLYSDVLEIMGNTEVKGDVEVKKMKIEGHCGSKKNMRADEADIKGSITVRENCSIKNLSCAGFFEISGSLESESILLNVNGSSTAKEIKTQKIEIKKQVSFSSKLQGLFKKSKEGLTADTIEGTDIYLEYTTAGVVRGDNVKVGPGCEIGTVEYRNNIEVLQGASVKEQKKI